jgi:hypothetical protein
MRDWIDEVAHLFEQQLAEAVMPLATFIAKNGGLALDGDARAADFHKLYVPGAGPLARKSGKSIDGYWREALADHGWIERDPDGTISRDIRGELYNMLHAEQQKRYFGDRVRRDDPVHDARTSDFEDIEDTIRQALIQGGFRFDPGTLHRAALLMYDGDETDPYDAYERAVMAAPEPEEPTPAQARKPAVKPSLPPDDDVPF